MNVPWPEQGQTGTCETELESTRLAGPTWVFHCFQAAIFDVRDDLQENLAPSSSN
jgi:hypothetical protein